MRLILDFAENGSYIEFVLKFEFNLKFDTGVTIQQEGKGVAMSVRGYVCSSKTKRRIYEAASKLFHEQGYKSTTLSDIAKAADVSTGTLYRYFPSKGDFLVEIGKNSVEHLRVFAQELPEGMNLLEAVLSIMLEDIRGTQEAFFGPQVDGESEEFWPSDIRLAYSHEIYSSKEHLDIELATRAELAGIYASVIEDAKELGTLETHFDSIVFAQIIVAMFFSEFDKGIYCKNYPYEHRFRERLGVLFEGRLREVAPEEGEREPDVQEV